MSLTPYSRVFIIVSQYLLLAFPLHIYACCALPIQHKNSVLTNRCMVHTYATHVYSAINHYNTKPLPSMLCYCPSQLPIIPIIFIILHLVKYHIPWGSYSFGLERIASCFVIFIFLFFLELSSTMLRVGQKFIPSCRQSSRRKEGSGSDFSSIGYVASSSYSQLVYPIISPPG